MAQGVELLLAACFTCTMHSDRVDAGVVAKDVDKRGSPCASSLTSAAAEPFGRHAC
jgi:hypothetical protein